MDSKSPDRFVLQVNRICKKDDRWSEKLRRAMSDGIHATILEQTVEFIWALIYYALLPYIQSVNKISPLLSIARCTCTGASVIFKTNHAEERFGFKHGHKLQKKQSVASVRSETSSAKYVNCLRNEGFGMLNANIGQRNLKTLERGVQTNTYLPVVCSHCSSLLKSSEIDASKRRQSDGLLFPSPAKAYESPKSDPMP
ncbi:hypothetical protein M514_02881 [Trichuris suis]|uniref:Uncharacterized protein n=1 Tax=Trichuris suis TaxID=68888 RepID=A0A085NAY4_9BILA|nr:hypothetical protein M513_02881 [Trichuris suis]KFD66630.1 hypothetical protein M514_02881 [Trichuris suis]